MHLFSLYNANPTTMNALHPSNPYYNHLSQSPNNLIETHPESPQHRPQLPQPKRSQSDTPSLPSAYHYRKPSATRTRSVGGPFSAGVIFERAIDLSPPNDDEIIITTVRVTNSFRRASLTPSTEDSALPTRPPRRNFLRRVSTRLSSDRDLNQYTAIKMPRRDYKKFFAKDREGKYVGTEPEREWTREDLEREFGCYQDLPLRSVPGGQEYGEGESSIRNEGLLRENDTGQAGEVSVGENGEVLGVKRVDGLYLL